MDLECQDALGVYRAMPTILGDYLNWTIENTHLNRSPFNLDAGDDIVCHIRSSSKCGLSPWSPDSKPVVLKDCEAPVISAPIEQEEAAVCKPSC